MLQFLSSKLWGRYEIRDETTAYTKFSLNEMTLKILIDEAQKRMDGDQVQIDNLSRDRSFYNLFQELHDFFEKVGKSHYVVGMEFPHSEYYIFPTDSYILKCPFLKLSSLDSIEDLYKKDAQLFEMGANSFEEVLDVITSSKKLLVAMMHCHYGNIKRGSQVKIVLRRWYNYKSERKFLLTFREKDWILQHKYKSKCVDMRVARTQFKKIIDYLHIPKFTNKTLEIHVSEDLVFTIIKMSTYSQ